MLRVQGRCEGLYLPADQQNLKGVLRGSEDQDTEVSVNCHLINCRGWFQSYYAIISLHFQDICTHQLGTSPPVSEIPWKVQRDSSSTQKRLLLRKKEWECSEKKVKDLYHLEGNLRGNQDCPTIVNRPSVSTPWREYISPPQKRMETWTSSSMFH